jgi:hypothetical protein
MSYRIYYADGSIHEGEDGPAVGEKARGVLTILQTDPDVGWWIASGADYYVWREDRWVGVDINGLFDYLMDTGLVVFGRMVDRATYDRIFSEAVEDRNLVKKSGFLPRRMKEHHGNS